MSKPKGSPGATCAMYFGLGAMAVAMGFAMLGANAPGSDEGKGWRLVGAGAIAYLCILVVALPGAIHSCRVGLREPESNTGPAVIGRVLVFMAVLAPLVLLASYF